MHASEFDLETLLFPISTDEFFSGYWENAPLIISRKEPAYYARLLSVPDLDYIVSNAYSLQSQSIELLGERGINPEARSKARSIGHIGDIHDAYRHGATIRVNYVQRFWKPLQMLCRHLEQVFSFRVKANLYCTPHNSQALPRHYDTHDVMVLQISGHKHWRVFKPIVPLPLEYAPPLPFENQFTPAKHYRKGPKEFFIGDECGDPIHEIVLEAGDLLYVPRGFIHEVWSADEATSHLSVGIHSLTWLDLICVSLGQMGSRDERFRKSLPAGFVNQIGSANLLEAKFEELLQCFSRGRDLKSAVEEVRMSFIISRQPIDEGPLANAADARSLDMNSLMRKMSGFLCSLAFEEENVALVWPHGSLWMPKFFEGALRFIAQAVRFRVNEIPGEISQRSKLALVRRLIRVGLLSIVRESDP